MIISACSFMSWTDTFDSFFGTSATNWLILLEKACIWWFQTFLAFLDWTMSMDREILDLRLYSMQFCLEMLRDFSESHELRRLNTCRLLYLWRYIYKIVDWSLFRKWDDLLMGCWSHELKLLLIHLLLWCLLDKILLHQIRAEIARLPRVSTYSISRILG